MKAAPHGVAALGKIWQYVMAVHEGSHRRVLPALAAALGDEEQRQNMATIAEQLIAEGKRKGRKEGIEEGQRATLLRQLEHRFGALPAGARERIAQARRAELERWLDGVLTAPTLDAVFGASR